MRNRIVATWAAHGYADELQRPTSVRAPAAQGIGFEALKHLPLASFALSVVLEAALLDIAL